MSGDDRYRRLEQLKKEIARATKLRPDDSRVMMVAALRLSHEGLVERLVAGETVDSDKLLALSKSITELMPPIPEQPLKVKVEFVDGLVDVCPRCHWSKPAEPKPQPAGPAPTLDLKAEPVRETKALSPPKPPAQPRSIHDGNLVKEIGGSNQYLGGFSSGRDSFGQLRWPNPNR